MTTNRRTPRMSFRMGTKNLAAMRGVPTSTLIDGHFDVFSRKLIDAARARSPEPDFYLDPEDEEGTPSSKVDRPEAMQAIVGAAFDAAVPKDVRRRLENAKAMAVVIVVPTPAWVAPAADYFVATFGTRWQIYDRAGSSGRAGSQTPEGSDNVAADLSSGHCVAGLAADVKALPTALTAAADITIRLPALTGAVLRTAIARFCRRPSEELPDGAAAGLDLHETVAAFRPGTGPRRIAQRLAAAAVVVRGEVRDELLPRLQDAIEYGKAQRFGLLLAKDVADCRAGLCSWADALPRGICLVSEPGLGKSLYPKLVSRACSLPLVQSSAADWFITGDRGTLDQVLKHLRATFDRAAALAPAILFLDEIDSIPNRATLDPHNRDFWTPVVNELLLRVADASELIIIGATNNIDAVDPALLRPGRLGKVVEIVRPDFAGTRNILRFHANGALAETELDEIAALAEGSTGAEIMDLVREGRRIARHAGRTLVAADLKTVLLGNAFEAAAMPTSPNMVN